MSDKKWSCPKCGFRITSEIMAELFNIRENKIEESLKLILRFRRCDGSRHKAWVIDQIVRILTKDNYKLFVATAKTGKDGPETYEWDVGIVP